MESRFWHPLERGLLNHGDGNSHAVIYPRSKVERQSPSKVGSRCFRFGPRLRFGRHRLALVDRPFTGPPSKYLPVCAPGALLIALGFEFVNGFHDTANAVATVIYTHSLEPHVAVVWSGLWNFVGVITSSGAVAFSIVSLLPVELILKVSKGSGFAMIFALLVVSVLWNLGTGGVVCRFQARTR
jgi:inorganic phosphate transporter, PiT family